MMFIGNVEPIKRIIYVCDVMRALSTDCELFIFKSALEPIFLDRGSLDPLSVGRMIIGSWGQL